MESEKIGIDGLIYKAEIETDTENKQTDAKGERGRWDELGDWGWHIYTVNYKLALAIYLDKD